MEVHRHLDEELDRLRDTVLRLGGEAERALVRSMKAMSDRDDAGARQVLDHDDEIGQIEAASSMLAASLDAFANGDPAAARQVITRDSDINDLYNHVFHDLIELMAKEPSTATRDARLLFIAKHLERIGDYVTDLCELTVYMAEAAVIKHRH